jgi:iron complex outermembrane recepter protein
MRNSTVGALLCAVLAGPSAAVWAETPSEGAAPAALEEIIVTAQRRSENLQRAALAVSAVSGDELASAGATRVQDLTALVPSVQIATAAGPYPLFYMRGVGNFNGNALSDAAVALNLDGVYLARPSSTGGMFYDLERLEVLKGPQGTLYGRNATGGAINVITRKPTNEFGGDAEIDVGNYGLKKVNAALNVPLSDTVAARLSIQTVDRDGYFSDGTDDDRSKAGRLQMRFTPSDGLSILTSADFYHQGGKGVGSTLLQAGVPGYLDGDARIGMNDARISAVFAHTLVFPAAGFLGPVLQNGIGGEPLPQSVHQDNNFWGLGATLNWTSAAGTLTVIPAFRHGELNYVSTEPSFIVDQRETDKQTSLEARFASPEELRWSYIAGVYYIDESNEVNSTFDQQVNASEDQFKPDTKSYAGFGRVRFSVTDSFRLTGGLRYTRDDKSLSGGYESQQTLCPAFLAWAGNPQHAFPPPLCFGGVGQITVPLAPINLDTSKTWSETTWRAGAEWDVAQQSMVYVSVETGYKAGGFYFTGDNPVYDPEKLTAYTLGSKNRFLDNRLQLNLEAYYWKYKDQQISHAITDSAGEVVFATQNVGKATMKGLEIDTEFLATDTTLLKADLDYLDATYANFVYDLPNFGVPPSTSCPFTPAGPSFVVNCSGRSPPQAPRWSGNLGLQQTFGLGTAGSVVAEARTHYQSRTLTGLEFLPVEEQPSYWMSSGSLAYHAANDRWSVSTYINNIENRDVINLTSVHPIAGSAIIGAAIRPPRTYGVRIAAKF